MEGEGRLASHTVFRPCFALWRGEVLSCDLFFRCSYVSILYRFRDITVYHASYNNWAFRPVMGKFRSRLGFKSRFEHTLTPRILWFKIWFETVTMRFEKDSNGGKSVAYLETQTESLIGCSSTPKLHCTSWLIDIRVYTLTIYKYSACDYDLNYIVN